MHPGVLDADIKSLLEEELERNDGSHEEVPRIEMTEEPAATLVVHAKDCRVCPSVLERPASHKRWCKTWPVGAIDPVRDVVALPGDKRSNAAALGAILPGAKGTASQSPRFGAWPAP